MIKTHHICLIAALCCILSTMTSCHRQYNYHEQKSDQALLHEVEESIFADSTLSVDEKAAAYCQVALALLNKHSNDSLGLWIFMGLMDNLDYNQINMIYQESPEFIHNDPLIQTKMLTLSHRPDVEPGKPFKEIRGIDVATGDSICLSQLINGQDTLIIEFGASWCRHSHDMIRNELRPIHESGKYRLISIAVWENDIEDVRRAVQKLNIDWTVIYTGGREGSPSVDYGVTCIPTRFVINPDGTMGMRDAFDNRKR